MPQSDRSEPADDLSPGQAAALIFAAVFLACLLGILTRPVGALAALWPANAVLLGLLLRRARPVGPFGWIAAAAAYLLADLITGSLVQVTVILTAANLAGVAVTLLFARRLPPSALRLRQAEGVLNLALACAVGAAVAGLVAALAQPFLFQQGILVAWGRWFTAELVNYVALLPVMLALPRRSRLRRDWPRRGVRFGDTSPVAALVLSCIAGTLLGGPGAIALPVLALLWCGVTLPVLPTTLVTLLFTLWSLLATGPQYLATTVAQPDSMVVISIRLGVAAVALAPIMLSAVIQNRNELIAQMRYLAARDPMTGVFSREAFLEQTRAHLDGQPSPVAAVSIELDLMGELRRKHGDEVSDTVLLVLSKRIAGCLRSNDMLGRMGPDAFTAFLTNCPEPYARDVAERIRASIAATPVECGDGSAVTVTASVGVVSASWSAELTVTDMLSAAEVALERARNKGRNKVEIGLAPC